MSERSDEIAQRPEPAVTIREVARAIGWLDAMAEDLEFTSADWSHVEDDGVVTLEGRKGDLLVDVTVHIKKVSWQHDNDADPDWLDDEEDDDE